MGTIKKFARLVTPEIVNQFVRIANKVDGDVIVKKGKFTIDGKSPMGVMALDTYAGFTVEFPEDAKELSDFIDKVAT